MLTSRRALLPLTLLLLASGCSASDRPVVARATPVHTTPAPTMTAPPDVSPTAGATAGPRVSAPASREPADDPLSPKPAVESPAPPVGQSTCRLELLRVTDADGIDDAGRVLEVFVVRTAQNACQLDGFPALSFVDGDGRRLVTTFKRVGLARPVTLSRTATASFKVTWRRDASCPQAAAVRVTLPELRRPLRTRTAMRVCATTEVSPLSRLVEDEGTAE